MGMMSRSGTRKFGGKIVVSPSFEKSDNNTGKLAYGAVSPHFAPDKLLSKICG